jgi:hypothetical protein
MTPLPPDWDKARPYPAAGRRWIYLYGVAGLLFVLFVGVMVILLKGERFRARLTSELSSRLRHPVAIGSIDAGLFPPRLILHHFIVMGPNVDSPILTAEQLDVAVPLIGLVTGRIIPRNLIFSKAEIVIDREKDGRWGKDLPEPSLESPGGSSLMRIELRQSKLHWQDAFAVPARIMDWRVDQAVLDRDNHSLLWKGEIVSLSTPVEMTFQTSGSFPEAWTGHLELADEKRSWSLELDKSGPQFKVHGHSEEWRLEEVMPLLGFFGRWTPGSKTASTAVSFSHWDQSMTLNEQGFLFSQTGNVAGGYINIAGHASAGMRQASFDFALKSINASAVENMVCGTNLWNGTFSANGHITVSVSSSVWTQPSGTGTFQLTDVRMRWPSSLSRTLKKAHMMRYLQHKYPDLMTSGLSISSVNGRWQVGGARLSTVDTFCRLSNMEFAVAGYYDLIRSGIDAWMRLQVQERNPGLLKYVPPAYVYPAHGVMRVRPMYGHIQGSGSEIFLKAYGSKRVPASALAELKQTFIKR